MVQATVILRSCGERTTDQCRKLLPHADMVIRQTPFWRCLRRCMMLGIAEGRPYTIMIDADLLPYPHLIPTLLEAADADPGDWYEKHGQVFCKFFGRRGAGNRIYRTALLPEALALIDKYREDQRPETAIIREMAARGHSRTEIKRVVALHGYEQYRRDIYRTIYVHAVKSRERIRRHTAKWRKRARADLDYSIALLAAKAGLKHKGGIIIDAGIDLGLPWTAGEIKPLSKLSPATLRAWKKWEEDDR